LERTLKKMPTNFPSWPSTQTWLRTVQESVMNDEIDGTNRVYGGGMNFEAVTRVLESIIERFGRQQDSECKVISDGLVANEEAHSGRVKLSDFYRGVSGHFVETKDYLMELGAIEEKRNSNGELEETYVLIPNYLQSISNCLPSSSMYNVCCLNQCEELLRHLENHVGSPTAAPEEIVRIVEALPSASVGAPRTLPDVLVERLRQVATEGRVPLHGRLFSQWMHHAYPRECPMPAKAGTTRPITAEDWLRETNTSSWHTRPEISKLLRSESGKSGQQKIKEAERQGQTLVEEEEGQLEEIKEPVVSPSNIYQAMPWDLDEELVVDPQEAPSMLHELRIIARALAMIGATTGLFLTLAQLFSSARRAVHGSRGGMGKDAKSIV